MKKNDQVDTPQYRGKQITHMHLSEILYQLGEDRENDYHAISTRDCLKKCVKGKKKRPLIYDKKSESEGEKQAIGTSL